MTAEQLKASLLQMAIQGKLVPQIDDEPAVDIDAEEPEEVPFAIPEKWKWVRIKNIVTKLTDGEHKTPKYVDVGIPFISVKNISSGKLNLTSTKYISNDDYLNFIKRCNPEKGDILLSKVGTTGVPALINTGTPFALFVSVALLKLDKAITFDEFMWFWIKSPLIQMQAKENTRGVGNKNWVLSAIEQTVLPLPPLAEQRRIVARLNELLPLVDEYGKSQNALHMLETELPGKLRASLLQQAIMGKLVPQLDDEPAVDVDAEEPEEVPFAIPEKWKWVRLGECAQINPKIAANDDTDVSFVPMPLLQAGFGSNIDISNIKKWKNVKKGFTKFCNNDVLLAKITPCFENRKSAIVVGAKNGIGAGTTELHVFRCKRYILPEYLLFFFKTTYLIQFGVEHFKGTAGQQRIGATEIKNCPFPLPPLAEQRRIVARLNEIFPFFDTMVKY